MHEILVCFYKQKPPKTSCLRGFLWRTREDSNLWPLESEAGLEGVFALLDGADPTYAHIEDGAWLSDAPYGTIHRLASAGRVHGVLRACVAWCAERQPHLRVDTHADNAPMLHLLPALGFVRCGIIHVADGTPRIAFERLPQVGG